MKNFKHAAAAIALLVSALPVTGHAKVTKDYPDVVALFSSVSFDGRAAWGPGRCTGTFIRPRLLLTASHCVRHFNVEEMGGVTTRATDMHGNPVPDLTAKPSEVYTVQPKFLGTSKIHPVRVFVSDDAHPVEHADFSLDSVEQDLAILEFAERSPNTREVADRLPGIGEDVIIIGYGRHGSTEPTGGGFGQGMPVKNYGTNSLGGTQEDFLVSNGSADTCESPDRHVNDWAICGGDSGGPLIDATSGKVLGVASTSGTRPDGRKDSVYVDLTSTRAVRFIRQVLNATNGGN